MYGLNRDTGYGEKGPSIFAIELRLKGHLQEGMADYLGGLELRHNGDGSCTLAGNLPDTAALYGLILKIRDSGVELLFLEVRQMGSRAR